jgi:hypothetical protein
MDDRHEQARDVIRQIGIGEDWLAVVDSSIPPALMGLLTATLEAYGRADLDALLTGAAPDLVIVQPPELPASRSYTGATGSSRRSLTGRASGRTSGWSRGASSAWTTSTWCS